MTTKEKVTTRQTEIDPRWKIGCSECREPATLLTVKEDESHHAEIVAAACQDHR